jgi:hypothetical protein
MISKPLLLTSMCALFSLTKAVAQDNSSKFKAYDYVVNLNNDTIRCKIKFRTFTTAFQSARKAANERIKYQVDGVSGSKNVDADSIKAYYLSRDTSFYLSEYLPGTDYRIFVKLLQRGKINLYEFSLSVGATTAMQVNGSFIMTGNGKESYWYANKDNDSLKLIKMLRGTPHIAAEKYIGNTSRKKRQQDLFDLFADNPTLLIKFKEEIKNEDYGWDVIRNYIKMYNDEYAESHKAAK